MMVPTATPRLENDAAMLLANATTSGVAAVMTAELSRKQGEYNSPHTAIISVVSVGGLPCSQQSGGYQQRLIGATDQQRGERPYQRNRRRTNVRLV